MRRTALLAIIAAVLLAVAGCGSSEDDAAVAGAGDDSTPAAALDRARTIERDVASWAAAAGLADVHRDAARVRALVGGPRFASDGDQIAEGLLPGPAGEPGLAEDRDGCAGRVVVTGDWSDPAGRWRSLERLIGTWSPQNNPFPTLPSHAERVFGWATLATHAHSLSEAREYAGHASGHAAIVTEALAHPGGPCAG